MTPDATRIPLQIGQKLNFIYPGIGGYGILLSTAAFFVGLKKDITHLHTKWECENKDNSRYGDYLFNNWNFTSRQFAADHGSVARKETFFSEV